MKTFYQFLKETDADFTPMTSSMLSDDALMAALRIAMKNSRPQIEQLIQTLANSDQEIRSALQGGQTSAPPLTDKSRLDRQEVVPPSSDGSTGD